MTSSCLRKERTQIPDTTDTRKFILDVVEGKKVLSSRKRSVSLARTELRFPVSLNRVGGSPRGAKTRVVLVGVTTPKSFHKTDFRRTTKSERKFETRTRETCGVERCVWI